MSIMHLDHETIVYTLARALIWTAVIVLTVYIVISDIRVDSLVRSSYVNGDEGELYDE
jgi:hypothetical protein